MKFILGTNFWSHHQIPVAEELAKILGPEHFRLALFEEVDGERRQMGWEECSERPWVIGPPKNEQERVQLVKECVDADVMVFGDCPHEVLKTRVVADKLTFVAAERLLKKPFHRLRLLNPRYARGFRNYRSRVNHLNVHSLAVGHYAPEDLRILCSFGDRIWKWGYFVDVNLEPPLPISDRPLKLLWVGRMLEWKKVDVLLRALVHIQDSPQFGECLIIGDGPERSHLLRLAQKLKLKQDRVRFLPPVPFEKVRRLMRESDVYVLSSNRMEGWGAVAGEAMSEGCVLVANQEAGSAQELVVDGETGLLYRDGDVDHLVTQLTRLADDYPMRMHMQQAAWARMHSLWSPRVAAERLVNLAEGLLGRRTMPEYNDGPCCRA